MTDVTDDTDEKSVLGAFGGSTEGPLLSTDVYSETDLRKDKIKLERIIRQRKEEGREAVDSYAEALDEAVPLGRDGWVDAVSDAWAALSTYRERRDVIGHRRRQLALVLLVEAGRELMDLLETSDFVSPGPSGPTDREEGLDILADRMEELAAEHGLQTADFEAIRSELSEEPSGNNGALLDLVDELAARDAFAVIDATSGDDSPPDPFAEPVAPDAALWPPDHEDDPAAAVEAIRELDLGPDDVTARTDTPRVTIGEEVVLRGDPAEPTWTWPVRATAPAFLALARTDVPNTLAATDAEGVTEFVDADVARRAAGTDMERVVVDHEEGEAIWGRTDGATEVTVTGPPVIRDRYLLGTLVGRFDSEVVVALAMATREGD